MDIDTAKFNKAHRERARRERMNDWYGNALFAIKQKSFIFYIYFGFNIFSTFMGGINLNTQRAYYKYYIKICKNNIYIYIGIKRGILFIFKYDI